MRGFGDLGRGRDPWWLLTINFYQLNFITNPANFEKITKAIFWPGLWQLDLGSTTITISGGHIAKKVQLILSLFYFHYSIYLIKLLMGNDFNNSIFYYCSINGPIKKVQKLLIKFIGCFETSA